MSYLNQDDYYGCEPSVIDDIATEAKDKIVKLIIESAKTEVDAVMKKAEELKKINEKQTQNILELSRENNDLQIQVKILESKLAEKHTKIDELQFEIEQEVYAVYSDGNKKTKCPTCDGRGYAQMIGADGKTYNCICPTCENNYNRREQEWHKYSIRRDRIISANITITKDKTDVKYSTKGTPLNYMTLFFRIDEQNAASEYAKKLTEESKLEAEKRLKGASNEKAI